MKKVLLVATVQSHIGQFHRPLAEVLHKYGYEVHVAANDNLYLKNGLRLDFVDKVFNLPFSRSPKSKDNMTAYKQLKQILDNDHYEVVHCNTPMGGFVTRLAARDARKKGTKVFYTAHGFHFYKGAPKKNWIIYYPIERYFSRMTDKLITITREDYKLASEKFHCKVEYMHGVGVNSERYFCISNEEKLSMRKKMGFTPTQKLILNIGELNANKNQTMAIKAMHKVIEQFPDALLIMAGNGPRENFLKEFIRMEGLEKNVRMIGYVTNLQDYQHVVDVQVCCSKREGLPLNVVESMLSGNPVVASQNRGHRELIENGKTGFIVPIDDSDAMAKNVLQFLQDEKTKQYIEKNALKFAQQYTYDSVKKELEQIYELK